MTINKQAIKLMSVLMLPIIQAAEFCVKYKKVMYGCDAEIFETDLRGIILRDLTQMLNATIVSSTKICLHAYQQKQTFGSSNFLGNPLLICQSTAAFNRNVTAILEKDTHNLSGYSNDGMFAISVLSVFAIFITATIACMGRGYYQRLYCANDMQPSIFVNASSRYGAMDRREHLIQDHIEMQPVKTDDSSKMFF
ncbi:MAG: hypothetical protein P1U40_05320 [Coxiellaceae bacterium]|nr:hypothetical protein [Coxiellaceae bacterium]